MIPTPEHSLSPTIMKSRIKSTWHYTNPESLIASSMYIDMDLENLRDHIMFPAKKKEEY